MTDEEKKAIDDLKEVVELYNDKCLITTENDFKSIEILLNLIEKQSKEIEELKDKNKSIVYNYKMVVDKLENSTSNDKIKAKIEELNDGIKRDMINYDKIKGESWKLAVYRSMTQKIEIKKFCNHF